MITLAYSIYRKGVSKARSLINAGKISDESWSKPRLEDFNSVEEFASYHLAYDPNGDKDNAGTYHYPYGKGGKVYRRAVANAKARAQANGETEVFRVASNLFDAIKKKEDKQKQQAMIHTIFRYDRVFEKDGRKGIPGKSYMGF